MGTQQTLLILLSVLLILTAISVGISIFNSITRDSYIKNCIQELTYFKARTADYFKTSRFMGGSSYGSVLWNASDLAAYIGLGYNGDVSNPKLETEYAIYTIEIDVNLVTFSAESKENSVKEIIKYQYNAQTDETNILFLDPPE